MAHALAHVGMNTPNACTHMPTTTSPLSNKVMKMKKTMTTLQNVQLYHHFLPQAQWKWPHLPCLQCRHESDVSWFCLHYAKFKNTLKIIVPRKFPAQFLPPTMVPKMDDPEVSFFIDSFAQAACRLSNTGWNHQSRANSPKPYGIFDDWIVACSKLFKRGEQTSPGQSQPFSHGTRDASSTTQISPLPSSHIKATPPCHHKKYRIWLVLMDPGIVIHVPWQIYQIQDILPHAIPL